MLDRCCALSDKELINVLIIIIAILLKEPKNNIKALKKRMKRYDNDEAIDLINRWVKSERGRCMLKRVVVDDISVESVSEEINLSSKQAARVIKKAISDVYPNV